MSYFGVVSEMNKGGEYIAYVSYVHARNKGEAAVRGRTTNVVDIVRLSGRQYATAVRFARARMRRWEEDAYGTHFRDP